MKILILNAILFTPNAGVIPSVDSIKDTMIYNMCLGFRKLGHEVTLCAASEYRPAAEEEYPFDILFFKSKYTRLFPPTVLPYSAELKRFLRRHAAEYDLVVSSEVFSFLSLFASLYAPSKTVIWQEMAIHPAKFHQLPSKIWYNVVARLFMRHPVVVGRSEDAAAFVARYHGNVSPLVADHGINAEKFVTRRDKTDSLVVIAQLIRRKNVDGIIKAFADFARRPAGEKYVLKIFGRGPLEAELRQLAHDLGVEDKVMFFGFTPHCVMAEHLASARASLLLTSQDLNVVSVPESIVCGTPVLMNSLPTTAKTVRKHGLGIVKDNWGADDIEAITSRNGHYVDNCIAYAPTLTSTHTASLLIEALYPGKR